MTETISGTNAAVSTLFLGQNGEFWDFWLIVSVVIAACAAITIGITTTGSIVSHKRAAAFAEDSLGRFKLATESKISESSARTKEAELKLEQLRQLTGPRFINHVVFAKEIEGKPKSHVEIWYLPDSSDGWNFSFQLSVALRTAGWDVDQPLSIPDPPKTFPWKDMPRAMVAGGQPSGITVVGNDLTLENDPSFKGLFEALAKSTTFGMYGSGGSQAMPVPKGTLRIVIAAKTDPIFINNAQDAPK